MPKMYVVSLSDAERLLLHQTIKKGKTILYRLTGESLKEMRRSEPALTVAFTETMVRLLARRVLDSDARVPRGSDGHETADTQSALPHPAHSPCPESAVLPPALSDRRCAGAHMLDCCIGDQVGDVLDLMYELNRLGPDEMAIDECAVAVGAPGQLWTIAHMREGTKRSSRLPCWLLSQDDRDEDPSSRAAVQSSILRRSLT